MEDLYRKLKKRLQNAERILFLGLGEPKLRDDAVGPHIITKLLAYNDERFLFINAGIDPMARIDQIIEFNPSHIVILDTCTLNREPGTVAILEREHMADLVPISSHTIPIHIILDYIAEKLPNVNFFMLGFVPENIEGISTLQMYGKGKYSIDELNENEDLPFWQINLTETLKTTADAIIDMLKNLINEI
ncbi:MAG: Hydrogenase 3 maturation protease [Promethearchaeota archaeon]|nr:MAG: Hydrogenase 3 maturation protease [Candidatus Lokiarchaeota archaeon]